MKYPFFLTLIALTPISAFAIGTIQASVVPTATAPARATVTPASSVATPSASPEAAQVDYFIKLPGVDGESDDPTPTPKPQEQQSQGIEPDEIDYDGDSSAAGGTEDINIGVGELRPDFGILLGGGDNEGGPKDDGVVVLGAEVQEEVGEILKAGMAEADRPVEDIAFNFEKISVKVREEVKLFGIIPVGATADVDIRDDGSAEVKFPWWAFLASGKDAEELGSRVVTSLSNVLKSKHDALQGVIQNTR